MAVIRSVVEFAGPSGLPEDKVVNVFHFIVPVGPILAEDTADIAAALNRFYCATPAGGTGPIQGYMAQVSMGAALPKVKHYEVGAGGVTGSPIAESELIGWGGGVTGAKALPHEVAVCLSIHADLTNVPEEAPDGADPGVAIDKPASKRRGRIFIGGLTVDVLPVAGSAPRPLPAFRTIVTAAGDALMNDADFVPRGISWAVFSKVDLLARDVVGGWCDDSFDTQRRRGLAPSTRTTF